MEETNPSFNRSFDCATSYMRSSVNPNTRTTAIRVATGDHGGLLKKNMFDAVIHTSLRNSVLVVRVAAVLQF